ncbi:hypothetical protein K0M31_017930 [Melipona bicolor]|uniref:Uncharacterized protein n=1 Tax=Melipona bicolor TaxID=60889 RepID=A0AA40KSZ7_9HYME|nr:hypothetical protein K0M31_017930 [Melipona bicolor]
MARRVLKAAGQGEWHGWGEEEKGVVRSGDDLQRRRWISDYWLGQASTLANNSSLPSAEKIQPARRLEINSKRARCNSISCGYVSDYWSTGGDAGQKDVAQFETSRRLITNGARSLAVLDCEELRSHLPVSTSSRPRNRPARTDCRINQFANNILVLNGTLVLLRNARLIVKTFHWQDKAFGLQQVEQAGVWSDNAVNPTRYPSNSNFGEGFEFELSSESPSSAFPLEADGSANFDFQFSPTPTDTATQISISQSTFEDSLVLRRSPRHRLTRSRPISRSRRRKDGTSSRNRCSTTLLAAAEVEPGAFASGDKANERPVEGHLRAQCVQVHCSFIVLDRVQQPDELSEANCNPVF